MFCPGCKTMGAFPLRPQHASVKGLGPMTNLPSSAIVNETSQPSQRTVVGVLPPAFHNTQMPTGSPGWYALPSVSAANVAERRRYRLIPTASARSPDATMIRRNRALRDIDYRRSFSLLNSRSFFDVSQRRDQLDDVAILQSERAAKVVLRDHLEYVCMVRSDRHDHGAVDVAHRREETFRTAERPPRGLEGSDLDARSLLEDLQLREIRARDLQVQGAFVRLEPELLPELVFVPFLPHVERALAQPARDGPGDRQRFFDFKNPLVIGVLLPQDFSAPRRESDPLAARRQVARDESLSDQLEDSLGSALLTHADEFSELSRSQVHVLFRPAEEGDRLQRLDVIRLQPRGGRTGASLFLPQRHKPSATRWLRDRRKTRGIPAAFSRSRRGWSFVTTTARCSAARSRSAWSAEPWPSIVR